MPREMPYLVQNIDRRRDSGPRSEHRRSPRTVEGIMQNEAALRLLARLERVNDARRSRRRAGAPKTSRLYAAACDESPTHPQISLDDLLKLKFGYVVTCQIWEPVGPTGPEGQGHRDVAQKVSPY